MHDIYVKIEWLCYETEIIFFETTDQACEFAQAKSQEQWVNYCKVFVWGFEQYVYDFGKMVK